MGLMRAIVDRATLVWRRASERLSHGRVHEFPRSGGPLLVVVDGVGRFQFAPYAIRWAFRDLHTPIETVMFDWQTPVVGEIWTDLMWRRRNRVMGARLARRLLQFHRDDPDRPIHLFAYSGGSSVGAFACESLRGRKIISTLLLVAPALSPSFDLAPALRAVERCTILVSPRDYAVLGLGTTLFGTSDRVYGKSAGMVGFRGMGDLPRGARADYDRCWQIRWNASLRREGNFGGHAGWIAPAFLRRYLLKLLEGDTVLWTDADNANAGDAKPAEQES